MTARGRGGGVPGGALVRWTDRGGAFAFAAPDGTWGPACGVRTGRSHDGYGMHLVASGTWR